MIVKPQEAHPSSRRPPKPDSAGHECSTFPVDRFASSLIGSLQQGTVPRHQLAVAVVLECVFCILGGQDTVRQSTQRRPHRHAPHNDGAHCDVGGNAWWWWDAIYRIFLPAIIRNTRRMTSRVKSLRASWRLLVLQIPHPTICPYSGCDTGGNPWEPGRSGPSGRMALRLV